MATVTKPIALDESLNTTEQTPRNVADVLAQELSAVATAISGISAPSAEDVSYDNSGSGLSATDVQNALDEIVSDIPTVNDGTLTIQQNGETKGTFTANQSGNSTVNIETPTADIQTAVDEFETYNGGLLSALKVSLTPNQDLHGYDHPWVGGAGKNKLIDSGYVQGVIGWNEATAETIIENYKYITSPYMPINNNTAYTLSAIRGNIVRIYITDENHNTLYFRGNNPIEGNNEIIPATSGAVYLRISIGFEGTTVIPSDYGTKVYGQLELGSTATAYEPYSNICPISGHTEVKLVNDGKNKLPFHIDNLKRDNLGGVWSGNTYTYRNVNWIFDVDTNGYIQKVTANGLSNNESNISVLINDYIKAGTSYKYNGVPSGGSSTTYQAFVRGGGYDRGTGNAITPTQANIDNDYYWYRISIANGYNAQNVVFYPMIYVGDDATYEPFIGTLYTVQIGQTVYGGTVDLVSGVMTVDRKSLDLGSQSWLVASTNTTGKYRMLATLSSDYAKAIGSEQISNAVCDIFKTISTGQTYRLNDGVSVNGSQIIIYDERYDTSSSASDFTTAMNGHQLVYELATPLTIQLSPTMVKALVGENHLSAPLDGQEITESKYREVFVFDDVEKVVNLRVPISMLGTDESGRTTASQAYASGDYFYKDGYMCKALTSISAGATLTLNTNYSQGTLADVLKAIENA